MKIENFAGTLIINKNKILLVQESHEEARGSWSFPLGQVEGNESIKKAAKRETKEETGLDVVLGEKHKSIFLKNKDFKSTKKFDKSKIKLTIYRTYVFDGGIKKGSDILDVSWFDISSINNIKLRGEWLNYFISNLL